MSNYSYLPLILLMLGFAVFTFWYFDDNTYDEICREHGYEKGYPGKFLNGVTCSKNIYLCEKEICVKNGEKYLEFTKAEFELWKKVKKE